MYLRKLSFVAALLCLLGSLIAGSLITSAQDASVVTATPMSTDALTATATLAATATPQGSLLVLQIVDGSDDVNESGSVFDAEQANLWIGDSNSTADQYLALRFTDVEIPPGSVIHAAHLEVYPISDQWISLAYDLAGEASDNSAPFSADDRPSTRTLTDTVVKHESNVQWLANRWYPLDEIGAVVKEVTDRPGWQSGNSVSIIAKGSESGSNFARKFFAAFESDPLLAVRLVIDVSLSTMAIAEFPTATPDTPLDPCATITLPTRLSLDHMGRVPADATRRVNVRPAPTTSTVPIGQVEKGMSFTVIGGPVCADGVRWFQVRYGENGDEGWLAEGQGNIYFVEPADG